MFCGSCVGLCVGLFMRRVGYLLNASDVKHGGSPDWSECLAAQARDTTSQCLTIGVTLVGYI